jgi:GAF domain-containing protein/HAMP domain-containing protein
LLAAFPLDSIQAIVAAANDTAGNGSYAILIDDNYLRLAHGRDPAALYQLLAEPSDPPAQSQVDALLAAQRLPAQTDLDDQSIAPSYPDFVAGLQSLNQQPSFTSQDTFTGATLNAVAATRLNSRPWVLAFLQAQPAILAPVIAQTRLTLLLAVLVAGLAVLASTLLARLVADPIIRITSIAERAAAGNLYLQASAASADEIGALGLAFNSMINQLRHTLQGLETRVAERTAELAQASDQLQHRADHLQAVAELAHAIAAIQDPAELLPRLTHEISTRFGYYHTGIFLLNADQTYAVLEAANSAGGARMLARHHRLRVGQVGIVGYVAGTGQPRIALDVGQDAVFFDNPDLPDTRSEISLPLKIGEQIIGVLDVQSVQPAAFSQDDIALLSTLADQVAMAIQNTRLYADSLRTVHELQLAQRQYLQQMWSQIAAERSTVGYQLDFGRLQALSPAPSIPAPALEPQQLGRLVVPLALRNQVIGLIDLQDVDPARAWTPQELAFARSVADQVALALENARLLEETRRRAERERLVSDITTRLRVSNDPQTILDTALSELRQALQVKSVQVRLQSPDSQPDHPPETRGEV